MTDSDSNSPLNEKTSTTGTRGISFDSTTKNDPLINHNINNKNNNSVAPTPSILSNPMHKQDEEDPKIQAISNLRCPSPPPILNKPVSPQVQSPPPPQQQQQQQSSGINKVQQQQQQRATTPQSQQYPSILVQSNPGSPGSNKPLSFEDPKSPGSISSASSVTQQSSLKTSQSHTPSTSFVPTPQQQQQQQQHKDTIPAGGALLRGRAAAQAVVAAVLAQTARNRNRHWDSPALNNFNNINNNNTDDHNNIEELLSEVNLQINEEQFSHHKAPSMHAHFYVDDTLKHGPITAGSRSRSGSGSTNESRNILEQLQIDANRKQAQPVPSNLSAPVVGQNPVVTQQTLATRLLTDDNKLHVLFGICGTVSTKKTRLIINKLEEIYGPEKISIQIIITSAAEHFVSRGEFPTSVQIWRDKDEWTTWGGRSDPVLHIELRRWADILVIAPLTSNTLSKIALGLCDNLLTNVVRAWNTQYPILVAPSMVSYAYNSPVTKRHLKVIKDEMKWIEILKPTEKIVGSYGDIGMGGMMDWNEIVKMVCLKAHDLGFNDDEEDEDDDEDEEEGDVAYKQKSNKEDEDEDDEDKDDDEDDDDGIKLSVAEEDEIEKVLKK